MAKATSNKPEVVYTLTLSQKEVEALVALFAKVAGSPTESARGDVEGIEEALREVGITFNDSPAYRHLSGSLAFGKWTDPKENGVW